MLDDGSIDLLQRGPRLRRLAIALLVGASVALFIGSACYGLSLDDASASWWRTGSAARAWRFIFYMAGLAGAASFSLTLWLLQRRARRLERRPPVARVVARRGA
ncbi:MAG: hypothetical protein H6709_24725 [Kofleriaceae bacterium]|mgnify:CR=1 FL=1|nr:hypothetical protein [Myxococcales bacterium]MCB9561777.1 hypothetical protein [Kofleriaceae bacterium]MCB9575293.1 hypothetical protein [Kofleriaceae bacterium]